MYQVPENLRKILKNVNETLLENYNSILSEDKARRKKYIVENFGEIQRNKPLTKEKLKEYEELGGVVGVDGSNNKLGGAEPHYIEIYQGLAKSTLFSDSSIMEGDYFTPLYLEEEKNILEEDEEVSITKIRRKKLVDVELEVALKSIDKFKPGIIMMDGSLLRYKIESKSKWEILREKCEDKGIILIGIVEDIKTKSIGDSIKLNDENHSMVDFYDREILYGLLEYGDTIKVPNNSEISKKYREGISSAFLKSSMEPAVIAIDIPENQKEYLDEMVGLVLALTPKSGRGIPLWLDIVDAEARIEDRMIEGLLDSFMDKRLVEMFFKAERDKRTF